MKLTEAQSRALLRAHGVYATEACDKCGKILGPVRFTRYGENGAWCSHLCRDGVEYKAGACRGCGTVLDGKRKGALYCGKTCRMRTLQNDGQDSQIIGKTRIQNKPLTDAILASSCGDSLKLEKSFQGAANAF